MKTNKILSLSLSILIGSYGSTCMASEIVASSETTGQKCGDNCTWTLDRDGNLTVSGSGVMYDYSLSNRAPWWEVREDINNVTVKNGITTIGSYAFHGAWATSINIPSSVTTVKYGFAEGSHVKNLVIPDTVTSLGGAFCHNCQNLESVYISENVTKMEGYAFYYLNPSSNTVVVPPNATFSGYMGGIDSITTYCTSEQISTCGNNSVLYEKKGNLYYVYDNEGNISEIYGGYGNFNNNVLKEPNDRDTYKINDDGSVSIIDKNGKMMATYSQSGVLMAQYNYGADGSVSIYDANGKLIGLQGKRILTVEEATALVHGNKNTFILQYR